MIVGLIIFWGQTLSLLAGPESYRDQANRLVSAEELNLIYASLPQLAGDKFVVLNSYRESNTLKYFVLEKKSNFGVSSYLIVSTSQHGVITYYVGEDKPFVNGVVPAITHPIKLEALNVLARYKLGKAAP